MRLFLTCWFLVMLAFFAAQSSAAVGAEDPFVIDPPAMAAVERFEQTLRTAKAFAFRQVKVERLRNGKVITEELAVKFQKPGRVYMRMIRPNAGQEVIYDPTRDRGELTVHPGRFPDLTLSLDVEGMLATHNQHHTVAAVGFHKAATVLRSAIEKARHAPHGEHLAYGGEATFEGRVVDRVVMITGHAADAQVEARERETLFDFARRVAMDAYAIYMANPSIRSLTSRLDSGEKYTVPAYYARRSESWFDRETGLPLKQVMWDGKGQVYERYEHRDVRIDPALSALDFDPENPAYGF